MKVRSAAALKRHKARTWRSAHGWRKAKPEPELKTISAGGCWCGVPLDHGWPGKGEGAPHPRPTRPDGTPRWSGE